MMPQDRLADGWMKKEIRILMLEDITADAALIRAALRAGGLVFRVKRVETKQRFLYELAHRPPDLILTDAGLAGFSGFGALAIAQRKCPDIPFVFVAGTAGVDVMIDSLRNGAMGYVLKRRLAVNLAPVVRRALNEVRSRRHPGPGRGWLQPCRNRTVNPPSAGIGKLNSIGRLRTSA